jgi:hypothetical protein
MKRGLTINEALKSFKKRISPYFASTDWPSEILGGFFATLLLTNNLNALLKVMGTGNIWMPLLLILTINLFWTAIECFLFLYTNLLSRGHYNLKISTIQTTDSKSAAGLIREELEKSIISVVDDKTKQSITKELLREFSTTGYDNSHKVEFLRSDILGVWWVVFFAMLPSIVILPIFLVIPNANWAIAVSDAVGMVVFFAYGYKLGDCTNRNKIATGIAVSVFGSALIALGMLLST